MLGAIFAILGILVALLFYAKKKHLYWKNKGVVQLETGLMGNVKLSEAVAVQFEKFYREFKQKKVDFGGVYRLVQPMLVPMSPDLLKAIMVKDCEYFQNHFKGVANEADVLTMHLFNIEDEKWRSVRTKLTPTFTSGKMKMMFDTILKCTESLRELLSQSNEINTKDILARFTTDVIGTCAFGIECNSIRNPETEFRTFAKFLLQPNILTRFKLQLTPMIPKSVRQLLNIKLIPAKVNDFFVNAIKDVISYREKNNIYRPDFMHLLIQLKNHGKLTDDASLKSDDMLPSTNGLLTMDELTAQCFVFFIAGFETSSTLMTFALFELAQNPEVQDKLRHEIIEVLKKHDNKITYEAVMEMKYLEQVLCEALRMYPPLALIPRVCTKTYKINNSNVVIEKGTPVMIPVLGIHRDEEYYPDPEKFDPDRFTEENKAARPAFTYLPFGEGPRNCIGLRFGMLQSKLGLLSIVRSHLVKLSEKTKLPLEISPNTITTSTKQDIWLKISQI